MRPVASTNNQASPRTIGIDDGPFTKQQETAPLVAALLDGSHLEDIGTTSIEVDGLDATENAVRLVKRWRHFPILLSGVTFAGFNLIDPRVLQEKFRVPVIIIVGSR